MSRMAELDADIQRARDLLAAHDPLYAAAPELLEALKKAYSDATHFLNYGNFKDANFSTANASCVDGSVEWNAGYIVDAIAKATANE